LSYVGAFDPDPRRGQKSRSIWRQGEERHLSMPPSRLQEFIGAVRQTFERHAMLGETPVLLTSAAVRPYVRSIIERFRPITVVMSRRRRCLRQDGTNTRRIAGTGARGRP